MVVDRSQKIKDKRNSVDIANMLILNILLVISTSASLHKGNKKIFAAKDSNYSLNTHSSCDKIFLPWKKTLSLFFGIPFLMKNY